MTKILIQTQQANKESKLIPQTEQLNQTNKLNKQTNQTNKQTKQTNHSKHHEHKFNTSSQTSLQEVLHAKGSIAN